jgi:hypothetical protein
MSAAPVLRVVTAREHSDCAIVALAMYLGASYEDVLRAVTLSEKHHGKRGLWSTGIIRAAKALGHTLKRRRYVDLDNDYGILRLPEHAAVLRNGLVIDCDGTVWDADAYLSNRHLRQDECELLIAIED